MNSLNCLHFQRDCNGKFNSISSQFSTKCPIMLLHELWKLKPLKAYFSSKSPTLPFAALDFYFVLDEWLCSSLRVHVVVVSRSLWHDHPYELQPNSKDSFGRWTEKVVNDSWENQSAENWSCNFSGNEFIRFKIDLCDLWSFNWIEFCGEIETTGAANEWNKFSIATFLIQSELWVDHRETSIEFQFHPTHWGKSFGFQIFCHRRIFSLSTEKIKKERNYVPPTWKTLIKKRRNWRKKERPRRLQFSSFQPFNFIPW